MDPVAFIYSHMKRRKQGVKIYDTESLFKILLSGIPQGSRSDLVQHINDLLFFINEAKRANFADDNTICATKRDLNELKLLKRR